jgi:hypothetical protein
MKKENSAEAVPGEFRQKRNIAVSPTFDDRCIGDRSVKSSQIHTVTVLCSIAYTPERGLPRCETDAARLKTLNANTTWHTIHIGYKR